MNDSGTWHAWRGGVLQLSLHVQPRATRTEIAGLHGGRLKLRLSAPPVGGEANACLCAYLAAEFGVAKSSVTLISGGGGREKRIAIASPASLPAWFTRLAGG